ncbi:uncharacterized protein LOC133804379 [Humulus lupulus]|uniref:uncharacterized protein LOC133804379 n=1 Tax=Humulus lupulus TaxID=3486 RepID=UPI002B415C81|nr:uncharacterized protein LOC133804379 [Humulus lupulus]
MVVKQTMVVVVKGNKLVETAAAKMIQIVEDVEGGWGGVEGGDGGACMAVEGGRWLSTEEEAMAGACGWGGGACVAGACGWGGVEGGGGGGACIVVEGGRWPAACGWGGVEGGGGGVACMVVEGGWWPAATEEEATAGAACGWGGGSCMAGACGWGGVEGGGGVCIAVEGMEAMEEGLS